MIQVCIIQSMVKKEDTVDKVETRKKKTKKKRKKGKDNAYRKT